MFSSEDIAIMMSNTSKYIILQMSHHDVTVHSSQTGYDWVIVSNYSSSECYILHRQLGHYKSLKDALGYIDRHEEWFADTH